MTKRQTEYRLSRRSFIKLAALGVVPGVLAGASACTPKEPLLRITSNVWPGYELLYLARELNFFNQDLIRLVEVPSATACIQSLAAGTVEGAMLTLDEVLTARAEGLNLVVVAVLDMSMGADVLLGQPYLRVLAELKNKRVGVEQSAVGAVMLDAALRKAQLSPNDIDTVYMTVNQHVAAYQKKSVDALVTFEPVKTQLVAAGANLLFTSAEIPGRIIDVLAVLPSAIRRDPETIAQLVAAHFRARTYFFEQTAHASTILAKRLQILAKDVAGTYEGILLTGEAENHEFLNGDPPRLVNSAKELARIMRDAKLLAGDVSTDALVDELFLPKL